MKPFPMWVSGLCAGLLIAMLTEEGHSAILILIEAVLSALMLISARPQDRSDQSRMASGDVS